jgi:hypothetical protein
MADLATILSGTDPTDPQQLQALQGQNIASAAANPLYWGNQGVFGGLARQMALSGGMNQARDALSQVVAAKTAAQPDLAAALASPDPYQYAASTPGMNPVARAPILQSTPLEAAQARGAATQASLADLTLQAYRNRLGAAGAGAPSAGGVTPVPTGRGALPAPATPLAPGTLGSGRYPGAAAATPGQPVAGDGTGMLPVDPVAVPPAQLPAYLQRLNPTQRTAAMARIRSQFNVGYGRAGVAAPGGAIPLSAEGG